MKRDIGFLAFATFYAASGATLAVFLALSGFTQPHIAFLSLVSLAEAYGIFRMKWWSLHLSVILTPPALTFGILSLYSSIATRGIFEGAMTSVMNAGLSVYVVMVVSSLAYLASRRDALKS